jgi:UDP-N-acetylglucosamine 3-dehydrogenase
LKKVLLVGAGHQGRHHARVIRENSFLELAAILDPAGDKFEISGSTPFFENYENCPISSIDLAVIAVPTKFHKQIALRLMNDGVDVLIEKPIADNLIDAYEILEASKATGRKAMVGHIERFNPASLALKEKLESGILGEVFQITSVRQGPYSGRITDVGVIKDLGTHDFDLTHWLSGSAYERVYCESVIKSGGSFEDSILITGRLQSKILVSHKVNWLSPVKERSISISGENGTLHADLLNSDLYFFENGSNRLDWEVMSQFRGVSEGQSIKFAIEKKEPIRVELDSWVSHILGQTDTPVSLESAIHALEVAETCIKSSKSGAAEYIKLLT